MTLEELFDAHHVSLFRFVARMTGDADFAKDVVQETFLSVARRPIPDDVPPKAWLFGVAQNLARSGLRKRKRRLGLLDGGRASLPVPAQSPAPDIATERAELLAVVRTALAALSEKERTMLLMRQEGFKHREIAAALGTTTGSVGTMLARAMAHLESHLAPLLETDP